MSQRDLTFNNPNASRSEVETDEDIAETTHDANQTSGQPENPFITQGESHNSPYITSPSPSSSDNADRYGKPFNAYSGSNDASSILLSRNTSEANLLTPTVASSPRIGQYGQSLLPSEFELYPSMNNSRTVSGTSLQSMSEGSSSNPFLSNTDFSPFGGYPASAFPLHLEDAEADDYLHNPDPILDAEYDNNRFIHDLKSLDRRSLGGLLGFIGFGIASAAVFVILPVLTYSGLTTHTTPETYTVLTEYKFPLLSAIRTSLIDPDTPTSAYNRTVVSGDSWDLVFSDEFAVVGRTFYDGDDQFFTAPDLHYDATKDLEWYDPDAVTTANGTLNLRMDAFKNHDLFYRSGMVQSWNQMCFTQGLVEISARLPNYGNITGLWPGMWTMGNLGRPGYLASTEGTWPYSYEACDAGITANQSYPDGISYLPGQRLNSCTCSGESHPNPGTGRGAPEIDIIEGEEANSMGLASQSLQVAPFDIWYYPDYEFLSIYNSSITSMNSYTGGPYQQAVSAVTTVNVSWYQYGEYDHSFQKYGFEYLNDDDDGHLTWFIGDDPTFTIHSKALHPNGNVSWRRLSKEPMSLILNLGVSNNWAYIDWPSLHFPVTMSIDYVRVYQPSDQINVGCDPDDYPTYDYIQDHLNLYENSNLTSFSAGGYTMPKNTLVNDCSA